MKRLPIEVTALTQSGRGQPPGSRLHEGIRVWRVDAASSLPAQFIFVGRLMLRDGLRTFDLLHAKDGLYVALSACIWARLLRIPTIREVTSVRVGEAASSTTWKEYLHRSTYTNARMLHAVNDSVRAVYASMGIPKERVWMSPYPVDTTVFRFPSPEERRRAREVFGFAEDDIVHFALGRIHSHKNQHLAVEALALLPYKHRLILAGPANEDYVTQIRNTMAEHDLNARVILLPERQQDPIQLFWAADIYLIPSLTEGGPNVLFEALCCGLPVIVNESIGETRYIHNGVNGFNVPLDPHAFSNAAMQLIEVARNLKQRRAISEEAAHAFSAATLDPQYAERIAELLKI